MVRKVTWLELFYDLVYIAAIIQLGSFLSRQLTLLGALQFTMLFALLWWAWSCTAFFFNRFPLDRVSQRLVLFAQTFAIGNLAIVIGEAFSTASSAFSLTYAAVRLTLVLLYLTSFKVTPEAQALARRYVDGFSVGAVLWIISVFVPSPLRFGVWALALGIDLYAVLSFKTRQQANELPLDVARLSERYGQFTLIVLGESFIKTISGLTGEGLSPQQLLFSALAFAFIAAIWWVYFSDESDKVIRRGAEHAWAYLHLPLTLGIAALGVSLQAVVQLKFGDTFDLPSRLLLYSAAVVCFASIAVIGTIIDVRGQRTKWDERARTLSHLGLTLVLGVVFVVGAQLSAFWSVALGSLACFGQILIEMFMATKTSRAARDIL